MTAAPAVATRRSAVVTAAEVPAAPSTPVVTAAVMLSTVTWPLLWRDRLAGLRVDGPLLVVALRHPARPEVNHHERGDRPRDQHNPDCDAHNYCLPVIARSAYAWPAALATADRPQAASLRSDTVRT
jgi:hypothetical protein